MSKLSRVKGKITKTNVLKKNPHYRTMLALYDFLKTYDDVGYITYDANGGEFDIERVEGIEFKSNDFRDRTHVYKFTKKQL